jgi:hypothetical protein
MELLLEAVDVTLAKDLQVNLLVMGPKDNKHTLHPKMEGLLHLGPNPLEGDTKTTP